MNIFLRTDTRRCLYEILHFRLVPVLGFLKSNTIDFLPIAEGNVVNSAYKVPLADLSVEDEL